MTTRSAEAISKDECKPQCKAGYQLSINGQCEPCAIGQYRTSSMSGCESCPSENTTANLGSTSIKDCNLKICSAGYFLNTTLNDCTPCPKGYYIEYRQREQSCESCPPDTSTEDVGSTSKDQCMNPCLVNGKVELCQANAYCVLHKKSLSYTCECKL